MKTIKEKADYKKVLIVMLLLVGICFIVYYFYSFGQNKANEFSKRTQNVLSKFNNNEVLYCQKAINITGSGPIQTISNKDWSISVDKFIDKNGQSFQFLECDHF